MTPGHYTPPRPTVPRDETDAAFETVRTNLTMRGTPGTLEALTTIQDEMKRLQEELKYSHEAMEEALIQSVKNHSLQSQLTETRDQLEKAEARYDELLSTLDSGYRGEQLRGRDNV